MYKFLQASNHSFNKFIQNQTATSLEHRTSLTSQHKSKNSRKTSIRQRISFSSMTQSISKSVDLNQYHSDQFLKNKLKIKSLKQQLKLLNKRKLQIKNPQYFVDLEQDIQTWKTSIDVIKNQILMLRKSDIPRSRRKYLTPIEHKQLYESLKKQLKHKNSIENSLQTVEKQINYYCDKKQKCSFKLEQIQQTDIFISRIFPQSKNLNSSHRDTEAYASYLRQLQLLDQSISNVDKRIHLINDQLSRSKRVINQLMIESCREYDF